jgi:hypothetical protein
MKIDVNLSKKFTINTGNYSSISPSVSLTAHEIHIEDLDRVHTLLGDIADLLLHDQIKQDAVTMATIKKLGIGDYFKKLDRDRMIEAMQKAVSELSGDIPF